MKVIITTTATKYNSRKDADTEAQRYAIYAEISKSMRSVRAASGKTVNQISTATGLPVGTIGNIESGRISRMSANALNTLAEHYGIEDKISSLMGRAAGLRIRAVRVNKGLSIAEAARQAGLARQRVSEIEGGYVVNTERTKTVADTVGVSLLNLV